MGNKTAISWTDKTWNPWMGCTKVSAGCKNCYMFREQERYGTNPNLIRRSKTTFYDPLSWKEPARVFTCSWSDFFHEKVPTAWLDEAWSIIKRTPHLIYQILTKRPGNIKDMLPADWGSGYPNVWLGVTVEDSNNVWRMEALAEIPAIIRFVSWEPAIGLLPPDFVGTYRNEFHWLIAGGESGPGARIHPHLERWIKAIHGDCIRWQIPFFFKQWGGNTKIKGAWGGDLLDGKQYHEFPYVMAFP